MINGISGVGVSGYTSFYSRPQQRAAVENSQTAQQSGKVWTAAAHKAPQTGTPVQPVDASSPVSSQGKGFGKLGLPIREGADPVEMAVRMRIRYDEPLPEEAAAAPELPGAKGLPGAKDLAGENAVPGEPGATGPEAAQAAKEEGECQTCKERKYQDDSDDSGVSFQTPTNIAPEQAASAVRGHEMEHVVREQAKAEREDRKVVSQNVTIHTDICPECGKAYVSGGTTTTTTKADNSDAQQEQQQQQQNEKQRTPFSAVA